MISEEEGAYIATGVAFSTIAMASVHSSSTTGFVSTYSSATCTYYSSTAPLFFSGAVWMDLIIYSHQQSLMLHHQAHTGHKHIGF